MNQFPIQEAIDTSRLEPFTLTGENSAAGGSVTIILPQFYTYIITNAGFRLVTDANVGDRHGVIIYKDTVGKSIARNDFNYAHPASEQKDYYLSLNIGPQDLNASTIQEKIPFTIMQSGSSVILGGIGVKAGDLFTTVFISGFKCQINPRITEVSQRG